MGTHLNERGQEFGYYEERQLLIMNSADRNLQGWRNSIYKDRIV